MNLLDILQIFPKTVCTDMYSTNTGAVAAITAKDVWATGVYLTLDPVNSDLIGGLAIDDINRRQYTIGNKFQPPLGIYELIELEIEEDFLEKANAILRGEEYDTRIMVPFNLSEEELELLNTSAAKEGITVDKFVEKLLMELIEREKASNNQTSNSD
jgi:hypothetical protein